MKLIRPSLYLTIITLTAGLICSACKKDNGSTPNIVGTWINVTNPGQGNPIRQEVYLFTNTKTVIIESSLFEASTNKLMGYSNRTEGQYELKGDSIRFYNVNAYAYNSQPYYTADRANLTQIASNKTYSQQIVFNGNTSFHFQFTCPPFASCIPMLTYTRQQQAL